MDFRSLVKAKRNTYLNRFIEEDEVYIIILCTPQDIIFYFSLNVTAFEAALRLSSLNLA